MPQLGNGCRLCQLRLVGVGRLWFTLRIWARHAMCRVELALLCGGVAAAAFGLILRAAGAAVCAASNLALTTLMIAGGFSGG